MKLMELRSGQKYTGLLKSVIRLKWTNTVIIYLKAIQQ